MDLQQLNRDVIRGRAGGKTIWQPRIGCWYDDRVFRGEEFPGEYSGCDLKGLYEKLGCSNRLYEFNACLEARLDPSVTFHNEEIGHRTWKQRYDTPVGSVTAVYRGNDSNPGVMPEKWWIESEEDLKVFAYIEEATSFAFNMDTYERLLTEWGHLGLPAMFLPRVSLQKLFIELSGVTDAIYLLSDYPDTVEAYFRVLSRSQEGMLRAVADCPIEWINYGDNLHSKILPPSLYEKYVLPEYQKRGDILHKSGKFLFSHWDGDVRELLPYARISALDGIEAITPLPQGDVTLEEVAAALGPDIFLVDGICSILFSETFPLTMLEDQARRVMELFEGHLVLGISDEFPSDGKLERIVRVGELVEEFNSRHG